MNNNLVSYIPRLIEVSGLTQSAFARQTGKSKQYIWQLKSQRRGISFEGLCALCKAVGVEVEILFKSNS